MAHSVVFALPVVPLTTSDYVSGVSAAENQADIIIMPRLSDGKILLAIHAPAVGPRSYALPILRNHGLDDGWRDPVLSVLATLGIPADGYVKPLGILRARDHFGLVVVVQSHGHSDQCRPVSSSEVKNLVLAGEIQCEATLAAVELLRAA